MAERSQKSREDDSVVSRENKELPVPQTRTRSLDELLRLSGLQPESRLTLTEVAVIIGSQTGRRPSSSTCWRWALNGVRGKKLAVIRIGGTLYTTLASVEAFVGGQPYLVAANQPAPSTPARTTVASQIAAERRQREQEAAKRHLDDVCSPRRRARL